MIAGVIFGIAGGAGGSRFGNRPADACGRNDDGGEAVNKGADPDDHEAAERAFTAGKASTLSALLDALGDASTVSVIGSDRDAHALALALRKATETGDAPTRAPADLELAVRGGTRGLDVTVGASAGADAVVVVEPGRAPSVFLRSRLSPGRSSETRALKDSVPEDVLHRAVGPVEVAILGPTEFVGIDPILRGRPLLAELVVYLALHPGGASTRAWSNALWPDRVAPPQTISNRLSEARQLLGFAPDDRPRLRRDGDRYTIADLTTDWARFEVLASRPDDVESWRAALSLVRGRPLVDLAQGQWAVMEGIVAEIEQSVVDCGLALGRALLAADDADGAAWAAQMALRCAPWDERLHRLLMRAADAAGNRHGVESALRHLAVVLEIDGDPLRSVHPQTAALYTRLAQAPVTTRP
jgi:DNA-binding SARP family transcriptional activator